MKAFSRANEIFRALAVAMSLNDTVAQRIAIEAIPEYRSNGKGKTKWHSARRTRITQRAAAKRRNVIRNRRAHRG